MIRSNHSGFTLIEVMIALLIVSVGVVSVIDATNKYTVAQVELEKKVLAGWVASNALAIARFDSLTDRVKQGNTRSTVKMGGHQWRATVQSVETDVESVFLVTVEVSLEGDPTKRVIASLTSALTESK